MEEIATITVREATEHLRRKALVTETSKTALANDLGLARQTVSIKLRTGKLSLEEFVSLAETLHEDPGEVLSGAYHAAFADSQRQIEIADHSKKEAE